jgi:hypothetical protein
MNENTRPALRNIERANAEEQIAESRWNLHLIGQDLRVKGDCLVDEDLRGLIEIATELDRTAKRLRAIAVELNGSTVILGEHIAQQIHEQGI